MNAGKAGLGGVFRRSTLALALVVAMPAAAAGGAEALAPRVLPAKGSAFDLEKDVQVPRLVIKLHEGTRVRLRDGKLTPLAGERSARERSKMALLRLDDMRLEADLETIHRLVASDGSAKGISRLFTADEQTLTSSKAFSEIRSGREMADLNLYMEVLLQPGTTFSQVSGLVATLNSLASVETAYAEPPSEPAVVGWPNNILSSAPAASWALLAAPNFEGEQGYLQPSPLGVDAQYAWTVKGGNGAGVKIVDVEGAWQTTHEDLPAFFHMGGTQIADPSWRNHGTAVMGEMVGVSNGAGVTGIAHGASPGFEAIGTQSAASAIANAAAIAGSGGVVLIELHRRGPANSTPCTCNLGQCDYIAMEYWQAEFDAIIQASWSGVTVVEAAGNGSSNLDDPAYAGVFDRNVRDSGAVMVGAASSQGRAPMCWTNFGGRVDVHGWGEVVVSTGYGDRYNGGTENQYYTATFSGTSSASPIVTGSVASIQGALKGNGRFPLTPLAIRDVLKSTGTAQAPDTRNIGPRPDLRRAFERLNLRP